MSDTALPVSSGSQSLREVWRLSRGHRLRLAAVALLGVVSATAGLVAPAAIGYLVDEVQQQRADLRTLLWTLVVMLAAAVAGAIGTALTVVLASRSYQAMLAELRENLVERAMSLPQGVVERAGTGDLISRTSDDVSQIADAAPQIIPAFTMTAFTIIVTLAGMTALDPWYGLALVILLPVYFFTMRWYLRTAPQIYQAERAAMSTRAQQLIESQRGFDTITGFGMGAHREKRVLSASWTVVGNSLRASTVQNIFFGRLNLAEYLGMSAILVAGAWLISTGNSTIGAATAAMLLFLRLFGPINQLLLVVDVLQSVAASLNRMIGIIAHPEPALPPVHRPEERGDDAVRMEDISFSYDGERFALAEIDLAISQGHRVAVVGTSGAGKTTLAAVLAGIHPPDSGRLTRPDRTVVITQEVHVFAGTLRDNLTLAVPDATDAELFLALETAHAMNLAELDHAGLDTKIGQGGHDLTSAQGQQLALARLVLASPDLAILDEATAEADSAEADLLNKAAEAAISSRTALVVAHRLSQAAACDRILVMEDGRIIEQGDHESLLQTGGAYASLWETWAQLRRGSEDGL